jgi:hypothetical protein
LTCALIQIKALKAAAPKPPPPAAAPQKPPAPAAGSKRPREDERSELPPGFFDGAAREATRPPHMTTKAAAAPSLPSGTAQGEEPAKATAEAGSAEAAAAPATTAGASGGGEASLGFSLGYGSSDEEEESEEEEAPQKEAEKPAAAVGAAALPEGFFDDKAKDAIAHNRPAPKKLDIDEEFAAFTEAVEEDLEALDKQEDEEMKEMVESRDKDERMETADLLGKVRGSAASSALRSSTSLAPCVFARARLVGCGISRCTRSSIQVRARLKSHAHKTGPHAYPSCIPLLPPGSLLYPSIIPHASLYPTPAPPTSPDLNAPAPASRRAAQHP